MSDDTRKCEHIFPLWFLEKSHTNMTLIKIYSDRNNRDKNIVKKYHKCKNTLIVYIRIYLLIIKITE